MERADLRAFVVEAHRNGYATAQAAETDEGMKRIDYERGDWSYADRYVGSRDFLGFEVVRYREAPVWAMNYYGFLTADDAEPGPVYGTLRSALERASDEYPFRGPPRETDGYSYENEATGDVDRFRGSESIARDGRTVYEGFYRGGRIR